MEPGAKIPATGVWPGKGRCCVMARGEGSRGSRRGARRGGGERSRGAYGVNEGQPGTMGAQSEHSQGWSRGSRHGGGAPKAGGEGGKPVIPGTELRCRGDTQESPRGLPAFWGCHPPTTALDSTQAQGTHCVNGGRELRPGVPSVGAARVPGGLPPHGRWAYAVFREPHGRQEPWLPGPSAIFPSPAPWEPQA